jgi:type II secretion system protein G
MRQVLDYQSRGPDWDLGPILRWFLAFLVAAVLLFATVNSLINRRNSHRIEGRINSKMLNLRTELGVFETDNGRYPTTAEGLEALVTCPPGLSATWLGPYLEKLPLDKWAHPFIYRFPGTKGPLPFDLFSAGADGIPDNADDMDWSSLD